MDEDVCASLVAPLFSWAGASILDPRPCLLSSLNSKRVLLVEKRDEEEGKKQR